MTTKELEYYTELLTMRVEGFQTGVLERIGNRIKKTGKISATDAKALNNIANIRGEMRSIQKELAQVTGQNIKDVKKLYKELLTDQAIDSKELYAFRGEKFIPFGDDIKAQAIMEYWAKETARSMRNLSNTKSLGIVVNNNFFKLDKMYKDAVDAAVLSVTSGTQDFHSAIRDTLKNLGGSGVKVHYISEAGRITDRRLDTSIRQNILWGAKQASQEYQSVLGERLGCDGFEVDYHPEPRPSHAFMGGVMFSYGGAKTIDGVHYPDGSEAIDRLQDYGCLHFRIDAMLGISQPSWDKNELAARKQQDEQPIEYNGMSKTGYEWKQKQRQLETEMRKQKDIANIAKAAGDETLRRNTQTYINRLKDKYEDLCEKTGLTTDLPRASVSGYHKVKTFKELKNSAINGIINAQRYKDMNILPNADKAEIPIEKFTRYALNPDKDFDKTTAFKKALGYDLSNVDKLMNNIYNNIKNFEAKQKPDNGYGERYSVLMTLVGENGKKANVQTGWIIDNKTKKTRLLSAYVTKKKFKE